MADSRAEEVSRRMGQLASLRSPWEGHWRELARLARPFREAQLAGGSTAGRKVGGGTFDGTTGYAATNLASGLWSAISNSASDWFKLESEYAELMRDRSVGLWCEDTTRRMRTAFAARGGNFYSAALTYYLDLVTFGTAVMYQEEDVAAGQLWHSTRPLAECYIAEDWRGRVDTVYRKFSFTIRQAIGAFGLDALPDDLQRAAEKEPERKVEFIHAVEPNPDADAGRQDAKSLPYRSLYIVAANRHLVKVAGYHELPYAVCRWWTEAGEAYGDGPAALARADGQMVNAMAKTTIVAAQKIVDPPLLATDETATRPGGIRTSPGAIIPGTIDPLTGRATLQPLATGGQVGLGLEMEQQRREAIREAFHWSAMTLPPVDRETATANLARQEERLRLMGPHLGRVQNEFLDATLNRAFGIMWRAGALAPPPPVLQQYPGLKTTYISPLARAQKVADAGTVLRFLEGTSALVAMRPDAMDNLDADAAYRALADGFGAPASLLRDPRQVEQDRQARAQQQATQAALAAAQPLAGAARDMAQAEAMGSGA